MIRNGSHGVAARGWRVALVDCSALCRLGWGEPHVCNPV